MKNLWCIRAEYGRYTAQFLAGGYAAIGWMTDRDLSQVKHRDDLYPIYREHHPDDSNLVVGQQVGQIGRFLLDTRPGDYVITPAVDSEFLHYGVILDNPKYVFAESNDGCPYTHRIRVDWSKEKLRRADFSVPFQNTIRSSLTVFAISKVEEFLTVIGQAPPEIKKVQEAYDPYKVVLTRILELDAKEFEFLTSYLLTALGFEGSEVTGKSGDGGVDATGELNVSGLAKVKIFVQAKRYQVGSRIAASTVRQLRQAIPFGGQGAFITTSDFQQAANEVATEQGFPRIGLINGRQLVDLLVDHWQDIPEDFRDRLGLRPGLVLK